MGKDAGRAPAVRPPGSVPRAEAGTSKPPGASQRKGGKGAGKPPSGKGAKASGDGAAARPLHLVRIHNPAVQGTGIPGLLRTARQAPEPPWVGNERKKRTQTNTETRKQISKSKSSISTARMFVNALEAEVDGLAAMHSRLRKEMTNLQCEEHILEEMVRRNQEAIEALRQEATHGSEG